MTALQTHLLLIEDDPQIQRFLAIALEGHHYQVIAATTGIEGLQFAASRQPDIVIVDLGLPDLSGLEVIRRLREWYQRPILVLSARHQEPDKVNALDMGADDYLTKPFGIGELLARLRVAQRHQNSRSTGEFQTCIKVDKLVIDLSARRVILDGTDIHLTPIEYKLLTTLAQHRGKIMTHRQLLREVWGPTHIESSHYLRIYMRALRNKIESDPARPRFILTEIGVGYRFSEGSET